MSKKTCVANLIQNQNGEYLFLLRSSFDTFHPGTLCLPGGGTDELEDIRHAVIRETIEESGLKTNPKYNKVYDLKNATIYYFRSYLNLKSNYQEIYLDNNEHEQYYWLNKEQIEEGDNFILDLKSHVLLMLEYAAVA